MAAVLGVQAGIGGIKILCQAFHRLDISPHPDQKALIGMQVLVFAPLNTYQPQVRPGKQDQEQQKDVCQAPQSQGFILDLRLQIVHKRTNILFRLRLGQRVHRNCSRRRDKKDKEIFIHP